MKRLVKITFNVFLVTFPLFFFSCSKKKWFQKVKYEGTIYDSLGGSPAPNVQVVLRACNPNDHKGSCDQFVVGYSKTDVSGHFSISEKAARSGRYWIQYGNNHLPPNIGEGELSEEKYTKLYLK